MKVAAIVSATATFDPDLFSTKEEAERVLGDAVRNALGEYGNLRAFDITVGLVAS